MEQITQLIQSYINFRTAVLRAMSFQEMTKAQFKRATGYDAGSKLARHLDPDLWQPTEIHQFARQTGHWEGGQSRLDSLASHIQALPDRQRKVLLRAARMPEELLSVRQQDAFSWRALEIKRLMTRAARQPLLGDKGPLLTPKKM